jgi:MoaA/NifB/PqqE/SkfB family radical SAM enzyme
VRNVALLPAVFRTLTRSPSLLRVHPALSAFLLRYLTEFPIVETGAGLVLHSHLPPLDSPAYARFVELHLVGRDEGPSHAQVAVTSECPQRCEICYNRDRRGTPLSGTQLRQTIEDLISRGVVWLGITGGEPILRRDLPDLVAIGGDKCAIKLFTTGMGVTPHIASSLREAGLFSVSVSIDDCDETVHDRGRGFPGALQAAVKAVEAFLWTGRVHVGISAVLPRHEIRGIHAIRRLLAFAEQLGVHELWLSEAKPTVRELWRSDCVLAEEERRYIARFQGEWNREARRQGRGVVLNYLGHFEGAERFGCNAGRKMVYVDPFGDVSPCVFTPFSFGNVRERPLSEILHLMRRLFPSEDRCFINRNWPLVEELSGGKLPMDPSRSNALLERVEFGPLSTFNKLYYRKRPR